MDPQVAAALKEWLTIKMKEVLTPMDTHEHRYNAGSLEESARFLSDIFDLTPEELNLTSFTNEAGYVVMPYLLEYINTTYPQAIAKAFRDGATDYYYPSGIED